MSTVLADLEELINCFDIKTQYTIFERLGSPRYILAPMVLQSELAFRMFCRKYGTMLCYTPMITSCELINDYKKSGNIGISKHIITCKEDRPLVVQLCSNNVNELTFAAQIIETNIKCDAIDINLGCPQSRAEKDMFGAFLLNKPDLVCSMVKSLIKNCKLPIFAKIRLLPTFAETLKFVKMLEKSGVSLIAIHGRQIRAKNYGSADLKMIKKIKEKCGEIPIISNGNINNFMDSENVLSYTKCDGVMSAEGIRVNPYLFNGNSTSNNNNNIECHCIDICWEYLYFVERYGVVNTESINKHILYFCYKYLMDLEYEKSIKCKKKRKQIGLIRKLLRWPKICKYIIQYKSILDLLERIIEKKTFKHPNVKIFSINRIKKEPGYIKYWHKHNKKSKFLHHHVTNVI